jgi:hypothetical protein
MDNVENFKGINLLTGILFIHESAYGSVGGDGLLCATRGRTG